MESVKYTIKEAVQAIQELVFGENTCNIYGYIQKTMQNNDISQVMNIETTDTYQLFTVYFNILSP